MDRPVGAGVIQVITVEWSKASRGGRESNARNAVPHGTEFPAALVGTDRLGVMECHWGERNDFVEPLRLKTDQIPLSQGYTFGSITVSARLDGLRVHYRYDQTTTGAPDRSYLNWPARQGDTPGRELVVTAGRWARVRYNGRFSCLDTGMWWYRQVVMNVAWAYGDLPGDLFFDPHPSQTLEFLADLW